MAVKKEVEKTVEKDYPLIKIKLTKSRIGRNPKQRAILNSLGLGRTGSEVTRQKRPEILGMVKKVDFMLQVTDVEK